MIMTSGQILQIPERSVKFSICIVKMFKESQIYINSTRQIVPHHPIFTDTAYIIPDGDTESLRTLIKCSRNSKT